MIPKQIYIPSQIRTQEFSEDQREFDFVITTDLRDGHGTIFTHEGWDFTRYSQNPVVCYQHRSGDDDPDNLIGMTVKGPWAEQLPDGSRAWIARVRFESEDVNPKAEKIRKKLIAGTLRMASIGAQVIEGRMGDAKQEEDPKTLYFTRQQLLEWSIVSVGSNSGALLQRNHSAIEAIRDGFTRNKKPTNNETLKRDKALIDYYKNK